MPQETTVLIVDAHFFPASLEEQLSSRQVFVEHATSSDVVQVASVLVPDLVVVSGKSSPETIADQLRVVRPALATLVVADRALINKLRGLDLPLAALVPHDLPAAAIAHRIATIARKSAQGELLLKPASRDSEPDPPVLEKETTSTIRSPDAQLTKPATVSKTIRPSGASAAPPPGRGNNAGLGTEARVKLDLHARIGAKQIAIIDSESPNNIARASAKSDVSSATESKAKLGADKRAGSDAKVSPKARISLKPSASLKTTLPGVAIPAEVQALSKPLQGKNEPSLAQTDLSKKSIQPSPFIPLPLDQLDPDALTFSAVAITPPIEAKKNDPVLTNVPLPTRPTTAQALNATPTKGPLFPSTNNLAPPPADELSMVAQLPIDLRLSLSTAKKPSSGLRLAYLDTDLTRADLLTGALRRRGLDVFPLTPDVDQTRWPLLRRFAPQALVVDEKGMARRNAEWVETFRGDPFLRHVPLIVIRLSRIFHETDQTVDLDPLLTLIEHLGQDEAALLEKLAPAREVDLKMSQIGPVRLLQLLTEQDRNTRIDCRSTSERMVWPLGPGYAGNAKLLPKNSEKVLGKLPPAEALSWLLKHEDLDVAVHEHTDPLAHPSESVDSAQLLRDLTDALGVPKRHESVRPGGMRGRFDSSSESHRLDSDALADSSERVSGSISSGNIAVAKDIRTDGAIAPLPPLVPQRPKVSLPDAPAALSQLGGLQKAAHVQLKRAYGRFKQRLLPLSSKLPEAAREFLPPGLLVVLGVLLVCCLVVFFTEEGDGTQASADSVQPGQRESSVSNAPQQRVQPESKKPAPAEETANESNLWKVAHDSKRKSCEELVGEKKPLGTSQINATNYLRQARKLLMVGRTDDAVELMCLSALNDDTGPAAEALAEYYLSRRSLAEAERWVRVSLTADPDRRKSQELSADIENQKGNWEESRKQLLATMRLSGTETSTLNAIGRKLLGDARQAVSGGDLPRAERDLRRAAVLVPESGGIALELAEVLSNRKEKAAALLWSERAYVLDPTLSAALLFSANVAEELGKLEQTRGYLERIPLGDPLHQKASQRLSELRN